MAASDLVFEGVPETLDAKRAALGRIGAAAGIAINPTLLFDYPTLAAIAGYFVDEGPS